MLGLVLMMCSHYSAVELYLRVVPVLGAEGSLEYCSEQACCVLRRSVKMLDLIFCFELELYNIPNHKLGCWFLESSGQEWQQ